MLDGMVNNSLLVQPPVREQYRYGLFSAAQVETADIHLGNGVAWDAIGCAPAQTVPVGCEVELLGTLPKDLSNNQGTTHGLPFGVAGRFSCNVLGYTWEQAQEFASAHLIFNEELAVETLVWTAVENAVTAGTADTLFPGLTVADATAAFTATPYPPSDFYTGTYPQIAWIIGALEDFNAKHYGSLGTIHLPRVLAEFAFAARAIEQVGARLFTGLGTPVVAGGGYTWNSTLAGFVSPPIGVFRSEEIQVSGSRLDTLDKGSNQLVALAERLYAVGADTQCPWGVILGSAGALVARSAVVGSAVVGNDTVG